MRSEKELWSNESGRSSRTTDVSSNGAGDFPEDTGKAGGAKGKDRQMEAEPKERAPAEPKGRTPQPKGGSGQKEKRSRQVKDRHKSSQANHNRKAMADKKMRGGML